MKNTASRLPFFSFPACVGIYGPQGSGKDTFAHKLLFALKALGVSAASHHLALPIKREYLKRNPDSGLDLWSLDKQKRIDAVLRKSLQKIGKELREAHGGDYFFDRLLMRAITENPEVLIVSDLRTIEEVNVALVGNSSFTFDHTLLYGMERSEAKRTKTVGQLFGTGDVTEKLTSDAVENLIANCKPRGAKPSFHHIAVDNEDTPLEALDVMAAHEANFIFNLIRQP